MAIKKNQTQGCFLVASQSLGTGRRKQTMFQSMLEAATVNERLVRQQYAGTLQNAAPRHLQTYVK